ncbi:hypothetical protein RM530_16430 [Algiphilus sp. W345]|uniref:Uncharacterized protein n=1 Tax=Banduia mediterranea TaxID=3075609 RepID=A0ABU2WM21_9GAMM|nr:hypothetical protein [Algiphilus sp. W345]MDT0498933.1 hypothetical protein [Algiphilus sp. W345]
MDSLLYSRGAERHPLVLEATVEFVRRSRRAVFIQRIWGGLWQLHHAFNGNTRASLFAAIAGEKISLVREFRKRLMLN